MTASAASSIGAASAPARRVWGFLEHLSGGVAAAPRSGRLAVRLTVPRRRPVSGRHRTAVRVDRVEFLVLCSLRPSFTWVPLPLDRCGRQLPRHQHTSPL